MWRGTGRLPPCRRWLQTDIRNAGGEWADEEVVTDQGLVTSGGPGDVPDFCSNVVEEFAEGKHDEQKRST
jgi:protease I